MSELYEEFRDIQLQILRDIQKYLQRLKLQKYTNDKSIYTVYTCSFKFKFLELILNTLYQLSKLKKTYNFSNLSSKMTITTQLVTDPPKKRNLA